MSSSDKTTLAENKVLILYVLSLVNKPISNDTLYSIVSAAENMNYFYFQQFLLDLIQNKYVIEYKQDEETLYKITDEGKRSIELTADMIPGILKLQVDNNLKENLEEIEDKYSITADYTPIDEKHFIVKCKITENNNTIFETQTFVGSKEQAKIIVDNWNNNATEIYPQILNILTN